MVCECQSRLRTTLRAKILPSEYPARLLHRRCFMGRRSVLCRQLRWRVRVAGLHKNALRYASKSIRRSDVLPVDPSEQSSWYLVSYFSSCEKSHISNITVRTFFYDRNNLKCFNLSALKPNSLHPVANITMILKAYNIKVTKISLT